MSASASASPPTDRPRLRRPPKKRDGGELGADDEEDGMEFDEDDALESEDKSSDEEECGWGGSSSSEGDGDAEIRTRALCFFCEQDEEHDPSEEYEPSMECVVCGTSSHRQCVRSAKADKDENKDENAFAALDEEEIANWKCPTCEEIAVEPEDAQSVTSHPRQLSQPITEDSSQSSHPDLGSPVIDADNGPDDEGDCIRSRSARKRKSDELDDFPLNSQPSKKAFRQRVGASGSRAFSRRRAEESENATPVPRIGRPRGRPRLKRMGAPGVNIRIKQTSRRCMLHITGLNPKKLAATLKGDPVASLASRTSRRRVVSHPTTPAPMINIYNPVTPFNNLTYLNHVVEDEFQGKPYGGILSDADADTTKTVPTINDRLRFDKAKYEAEEEPLRLTAVPNTGPVLSNGADTAVNGPTKSRDNISKTLNERIASNASKIQNIHFGGYEIDTWYSAPYPEEYSKNKTLYICEFCLKYMNSEYVSWRHKMKCPAKHPPGDEIYRDGSISVFEVDGRKNSIYCQNLCLLAKLFLGSKTLYYDVEPFLFYVMTESDEFGCHFVGYFSKEKRSTSQNNVSCILTLPIHQRKGYGNLLIDFSYLLTRTEGKTGSPEKPLSDMGLVSYRNYWRLVLCYQLRNQKKPLSMDDISNRTGMTADDIICGLEGLQVLVRDPLTGAYALRLDYAAFQMHIDKWEAKSYVKLDPKALVWTPFLMGRVEAQAPPVSTVAPREDAETDASVEAENAQVQLQECSLVDAGTRESKDKSEGKSKGRNGSEFYDEDGDLDMKVEEPLSSIEKHNETGLPKSPEKGKGASTDPPVTGKSPYLIKLGHELDSPTSHPSPLYNAVPYEESCCSQDAFDIPPTRFEIYPPLPGSYPRRGTRSGTGLGPPVKGSRKRNMLPSVVTPARASSGRAATSRSGRTRSNLTDTVKVMGSIGRRPMSTRGEDFIPDSPTPGSSTEYPVPSTEYPQLSTEYPQPSTEYPQPSTEYPQPSAPPFSPLPPYSSLPPPPHEFGVFNGQDSGVGSSSAEGPAAPPPASLRGKAPRASLIVSSQV